MKLASLAIAAVAVALVASSAQAQTMGQSGGSGGHRHQQQNADKSGAQKPKADEKAYASALQSIPNKQFDPWHGVR